jgi:hypothetical protein
MAENAIVYLTIKQAIAWAMTRDLEFVEQIADSPDRESVRLDVQIAITHNELWRKGRLLVTLAGCQRARSASGHDR